LNELKHDFGHGVPTAKRPPRLEFKPTKAGDKARVGGTGGGGPACTLLKRVVKAAPARKRCISKGDEETRKRDAYCKAANHHLYTASAALHAVLFRVE